VKLFCTPAAATTTRSKQKCKFCQQPLRIDGQWQACDTCHVDFTYWHDPHTIATNPGIQFTGFQTKFFRHIGDWMVSLNLYHSSNKTVLQAWHKDYGTEFSHYNNTKGHTTLVINHCMNNVTPENCIAKMKFLLVWQ
jgi:hypothetical protein